MAVMMFIMQPMYLPWVGIFKAINDCSTFVFYDDVQFEKQSWQCRNRIRSDAKDFTYLRVPVGKPHLGTLIKDVPIVEPDFWREHLDLIARAYESEPYTKQTLNLLREFYKGNWSMLSGLNICLTKAISRYIGLNTDFRVSSDYKFEGGKSEKLANICKNFGETEYLAAIGSKDYLDLGAFKGIEVKWLDITPPSKLSIVDYLCRYSPSEIRNIIKSL
jgi:hypothetical protein